MFLHTLPWLSFNSIMIKKIKPFNLLLEQFVFMFLLLINEMFLRCVFVSTIYKYILICIYFLFFYYKMLQSKTNIAIRKYGLGGRQATFKFFPVGQMTPVQHCTWHYCRGVYTQCVCDNPATIATLTLFEVGNIMAYHP